MVKDLLYSIIQPHLEQVSILLNEYKYDKEFVKEDVRFIAVVIYLAGIDKLSSFTMIALWIGGRIKFKELKKSRNKNWSKIYCDRGLLHKVNKLKNLGLIQRDNITWLTILRNYYIHGLSIEMGYRIYPKYDKSTKGTIEIIPSGPSLNHSADFQVDINLETLNHQTESLIENISNYIRKTAFEKNLKKIKEELRKLPVNPEPYYSKIKGYFDSPGHSNKIDDVIEDLNNETMQKIFKKIGLI
ncbi:hypothetical protein DRQ23_06820 [bacterium]|nr:MAG: hypothetical protein DRQ23_06820 [bacterium]